MREIRTHLPQHAAGMIGPSDLIIKVLDEPGAGGANHVYAISGADMSLNTAAKDAALTIGAKGPDAQMIVFQCGGIPNSGVNGLTQEALLAIVADRLQAFQDGPFPSQENADALRHVNEALRALHKRTQNRIKRGVEGQAVA